MNNQIVNLRESLTTPGLDSGPHTIKWHPERYGNEGPVC